MNTVRFFLLALALPLLLTGRAMAQNNPDDTGVGVTEHLGDTIPMNLTFYNEQNQPVQLKDVIKKPTILALVYFDCPGLCNPLLDGISDVIENVGMELGKDYEVLTVSFNFNDTPEKAAEKKKNFLRKHSQANPEYWHYLTGDSTNVYALVNAVGFRFKKAGNDYVHPAVITILSPAGKITRYLYGVTFLPFDVKMALIEAQKGEVRPTINRLLQFCFSYDPQGRKYTLQVTKVAGSIILFFGVLLLLILLIRSGRKKNKNRSNQPGSTNNA